MKQTKMLLFFLVLLVASLLFRIQPVSADIIITDTHFTASFYAGEAFKVQDILHSAVLTFSVTAGSFVGDATLTLTSIGGSITCLPIAAGSISASANATVFFYFNGIGPATAMNYLAGAVLTITWTYSTSPLPTPVIVVNQGTTNSTLYFRSDTQVSNGETGNMLDFSNSASTQTIADVAGGSVTVTYAFRVWLLHYTAAKTELTLGVPVGNITRATSGTGAQTASWTAPTTTLDLGFDALEVVIYLDVGSGWISRATYLTVPLLYKQIIGSAWTFTLYTNRTVSGGSTYTSFSFGSSTYPSGISGVQLVTPSWFEVGNWQLQTGNVIGFIFYCYYQEIGAAAYLLMLIIPLGSLYIRHKTLNVILFLFVILGGSAGSVAWIFVPVWAASLVTVFLLLIFGFLIWRTAR